MSPFWSDFVAFLLAVVSHWQSYVTGGVVTALIGVIERLSGKQLSKKAYFAIFVLMFLSAACFMAWRDEYNLANSAHDSNIALGQKVRDLNDKLAQAANASTQAASSQPSTDDFKNLQSEVKRDRELIESLKSKKDITVYPVTSGARPGLPMMEYVLTTNAIRTPVYVSTTCDFPIADVGEHFMTLSGGSVEMTNNQRVSRDQYTIAVLSPAWSPTSPLWVSIYLQPPVDHMPTCSFELK